MSSSAEEQPSRTTELTQGEVNAMTAVVKDARPVSLLMLILGPVVFPVLIPLGTGLVWWRLFQWHLLALKKPALTRDHPASLVFHDSEDDPRLRASLTDLIDSYRAAKLPLWLGAIFWPAAVVVLYAYFGPIM